MNGPKDAGRTVILPNRNTGALLAVVLAMWYAGASQNNGAAYLLCFTLASVAAVSAVHAWANLRGLSVRARPVRPVFAGERVTLPLDVRAGPGRTHLAVELAAEDSEEECAGEVRPGATVRVALTFSAKRRGRFEERTVILASRFPLGFFTARRRVVVAQTHFVYPEPGGDRPLPASRIPALGREMGASSEAGDFAGLRPWRPGESMRHVHWKAVARGQPPLTKLWSSESGDRLDLTWEAAAPLAPEARLRQLARWVVTAEGLGAPYGLRLPGTVVEAGRGEAHFHRCLRALAAAEFDDAAQPPALQNGDDLAAPANLHP